MRKACATIILLASAIVFLPGKAVAQAGEVFGGYSYLRSSAGSGYNTNGWEGSLTGNFNRFFGLEVDLSDHYNQPNLSAYSNGLSFLFGPHFAYRRSPTVQPFTHVLFGGTRGSQQSFPPGTAACPSPGCSSPELQRQTAFTEGFGGGLDLKANRFLWIRLVQVDYVHESFSADLQNGVRLSFGVVVRFSR
jgi:hypothetical protein